MAAQLLRAVSCVERFGWLRHAGVGVGERPESWGYTPCLRCACIRSRESISRHFALPFQYATRQFGSCWAAGVPRFWTARLGRPADAAR